MANDIKTLCETFTVPEGFGVKVTPRNDYTGARDGSYLVSISTRNGATKALWSAAWAAGKAMRLALCAPEYSGTGTMSRKMQIHWIFDSGFTPRAYGVSCTFVIVPAMAAVAA